MREKSRMPELLVPERVESPFRELYRGLIVTSIMRSVEEQKALSHGRNRRRRASRLERAAAQLSAVVAEPRGRRPTAPAVAAPIVEVAPAPTITSVSVRLEPPAPVAPPALLVDEERTEPATALVLPVIALGEQSFGHGVRRAAAAVWALTAVVLVVNTIVLGFGSPATGAADLALIALTLVWFAIAVGGLSNRR